MHHGVPSERSVVRAKKANVNIESLQLALPLARPDIVPSTRTKVEPRKIQEELRYETGSSVNMGAIYSSGPPARAAPLLDDVRDLLTLQYPRKLFHHRPRAKRLHLVRRSSDVRGHDQVVEPVEGIPVSFLGRWLDLEGVQGSTSNDARSESFVEIVLVDYAAACRVSACMRAESQRCGNSEQRRHRQNRSHNDRVPLHAGEHISVDHPASLGRQWQVKREYVDLGQHVLKGRDALVRNGSRGASR